MTNPTDESLNFRGPALSVALINELSEGRLQVTAQELRAAAVPDVSNVDGRLEAALNQIGSLSGGLRPDRPDQLGLRIGRWTFSASAATFRTLRLLVTEAAALNATGMHKADVVAAVVAVIAAFPELLAAHKLTQDELKVLIAIESTPGGCTAEELSLRAAMAPDRLASVLDSLLATAAIVDKEGIYQPR